MRRVDPRVLLAILLALGGSAAADVLTPAEERGKQIYTAGESASNRIITADIAKTEAPASASIIPCVQCHGIDGRGDNNVGANITWTVLTDPDGHVHQQRAHGAFSEDSVARAIREGVDPAGNEIDLTMPRYTMADADMQDLVAYLKRIGAEQDPGLSATRIRIGTVLPTSGRLEPVGSAMRDLLDAFFDYVNGVGGIHGRELELVVGEYGADNIPAFWTAQDFVREEPVFALVATYLPGYEEEIAFLADAQRLPHIGPHTMVGAPGKSRYEFFLQAGLAQQAEALVEAQLEEAAESEAGPPKLGVVFSQASGLDVAGEAVRERGLARTGQRVATVSYAPGAFDVERTVATLKGAGAQGVIFLGMADDFVAFAEAAAAAGWSPDLLAPAILAERAVFELPADYGGDVSLSYASLPSDRTQEGVLIFEELHRRNALGYEQSVAQIAAFTAARVLVAALEQAGPEPSRERLITVLEAFRDFEPGLTAALTFGEDRRMGPGGAHVVGVDVGSRKLGTETRWIDLADSAAAD